MEKKKKIIIILLSILMIIVIMIIIGVIFAKKFESRHGSSLPRNTMHCLPQSQNHTQNRTQWRLNLIHTHELISNGGNFQRGMAKMLRPHAVFESEVIPKYPRAIGEYLVKLEVGNPPQIQHLSVDTGSDVTWVQCKDCERCYPQTEPKFDPKSSTSFHLETCESKACKAFGECLSPEKSCSYTMSYFDDSITKGIVMTEQIRMGGGVAEVSIGCGRDNQGIFNVMGGIMGLGNGPMSFLNQLDVGVRGGFTYCLSSSVDLPAGWLEFGPWSFHRNAVWAPLEINPKYPSVYFIKVLGIAVGDVRLPIPEEAFEIKKSGDGGVALDSGSQVTVFPKDIYTLLRKEFVAQAVNMTQAPPSDSFDTCYYIGEETMAVYPFVSFVLPGATYTVGTRGTLIKADENGTYCFAFAPGDFGFSIIGGVQQAGIQVSYDLCRNMVGFGPKAC